MKTHPLNVSYLVIGLVFLGIAGSWALRAARLIDTSDVQWLVPLSLVIAGAIGLVAFAAKGITRSPGSTPGSTPAPPTQDEPSYRAEQDTTTYPTSGTDTGPDAETHTGPDAETQQIEGEHR